MWGKTSPGDEGGWAVKGIKAKLFRSVAVASVAATMGIAPGAFAQEISPTGGQAGGGLAIGSWLAYPKIFVGAVWDSNPTQFTTQSSNSELGVRVVPDIRAIYDGGIHKTLLYGVADARFLNSDTISATAGFTHTYEAMQDLRFLFLGNYTRQTDLFTSALNFNNGAIGPSISPDANVPIVLNPFGTTPGVNPTAYNQFTLGASAFKNFNNAFVSVSGTAFYIAFDKFTALPFNDPF